MRRQRNELQIPYILERTTTDPQAPPKSERRGKSLPGQVTAAGGENAPAYTRRIASEAALADGQCPAGERDAPGRPAPSYAIRSGVAENAVLSWPRMANGDSLMHPVKPCARSGATHGSLSFDRAPAAAGEGIGFGSKAGRPLGGGNVPPAGFACPEERFNLAGKIWPFRPRLDRETGCAFAKDGADGFGMWHAHAGTAGSFGKPVRDRFAGRDMQDPSAAEFAMKPVGGCERSARGDRPPKSLPNPRETPLRDCNFGSDTATHSMSPLKPCAMPLRDCRADSEAAACSGTPPKPSETPPKSGGASFAPSRRRSGHGEAANSSACPPPFARSVTKSRQMSTARTEPEFGVTTGWPAKQIVAIGNDDRLALDAEAPLPETDADNFAATSAPFSSGTRNHALLDAIIAEESGNAAHAIDAVPPWCVNRPGLVGRSLRSFMKGPLRISIPHGSHENESAKFVDNYSLFIAKQTNSRLGRMSPLRRDEFRNSPMKENPGFARRVRKGEDASNKPEFARLAFFGSLVASRSPLRDNEKNRAYGDFNLGRTNLGFASSESAIALSGIEPRKELAP